MHICKVYHHFCCTANSLLAGRPGQDENPGLTLWHAAALTTYPRLTQFTCRYAVCIIPTELAPNPVYKKHYSTKVEPLECVFVKR
jgi:hypothetical protein